MKNILKYLVSGLLLTGIISCKKGWLDVTASNQIKAKDQFAQPEGYKDALMGVYIGMTQPASYGKDMTWNMVDILSRQYQNLTAGAIYYPAQEYAYKNSRIVGKVNAIWKQQYNTIANVNAILDEMKENSGVLSQTDFSIIKGELLGLRAFLHFDLLRLYGDYNYANRPELKGKMAIPYVTILSKDLTPQLSYEATFALMEKDISDALELLKEDPVYQNPGRPADYYSEVNRDGFYNLRTQRMNYYAVKALQARVSAWQGSGSDWQKAGAAAQEVIDHFSAKLHDPSVAVGQDKILSSEQIFSLNVTAFRDVIGNVFDGERYSNTDGLVISRTAAESLFETSNPNIGVPDIRFNSLLLLQTNGMTTQKYNHSNNSPYRNILPLIKLPEMYYIISEAHLSDNLPKSIEYLNKVRESRGILQPIPAGATLQEVEKELLKEYRKEYISEGQLFFFYKRKGMSEIPGLSSQIIANDQIYRLPFPDSEFEFGNRVQ